MKRLCVSTLLLVLLMATPEIARERGVKRTHLPQTKTTILRGRWRVKFRFGGLEKNLILISRPGGLAYFQLLDTEPDDKPAAAPAPAVWSVLTNDRVSFAGDAELPFGTCCREVGTLIFKGKMTPNQIDGTMLFITSVEEEESVNKVRSLTGTFTATRIMN